MSQTSYATSLSAAFPGVLSDISSASPKSALNVNAGTLPFGIGVKASVGSNDDGVDVPASSSDKVAGITIRSASQNNIGLGATNTGVLTGDRLSILERGKVYVLVEEAVTPASPVYCRYASGAGGTQLGSFRASADTATAALVKGARYETSAGIGGLAVLFFDALVANS